MTANDLVFAHGFTPSASSRVQLFVNVRNRRRLCENVAFCVNEADVEWSNG